MKRGEVWTLAGGGEYTGKPRPVVILQDDRFDATESVTICALTTVSVNARMSRPVVHPSEGNGLRSVSRLMADKVTTVSRKRLGRKVGALNAEDMSRLGRAVIVFLGLGSIRGS